MKTNRRILQFILAGTIATSAAAESTVPELRMNAEVNKTNAVLIIDEGDVCTIRIGKKSEGMCAKTSDFKGKKLQVMAGFAASVTEAELVPLRVKGGSSIVGTLECKRIRMGTLPDIPQLNQIVLADGCTIKALKNK